ncbi:MAG: SGNH/GDSL hydrolase family protein [Egibacteraceae bacterium]
MSRRRTVAALIGLPAVFVAVLVVEAWTAVRAEYLPTRPDYAIDRTVTPPNTTGPVVRMAVLGDSTVAGVGSPTAETTLPVLLAQRVAARLNRPVQVLGYGVSGGRTRTVRREQLPRVAQSLDVIVLVVGSNDVIHATPWWQMDERTRRLVEAARSQTGAPVVLGGIPQFRTVPAFAQPLRWVIGRYAAILRSAQRRGVRGLPEVRYVDIAALASPRFLGRPRSMSSDGFHPAPLGYGFWADALAPAVAAAVRRA